MTWRTRLLALALLAFLVFVNHVWAQERHDLGHAMYHDTYMTWMQPDAPTVSCCRARVVGPNGTMTGDCRPTAFRVVGEGKATHWQAQLDNGSWIDIPDSKLIHEKNPDPSGVTGHLCEQNHIVFCARPPNGTL